MKLNTILLVICVACIALASAPISCPPSYESVQALVISRSAARHNATFPNLVATNLTFSANPIANGSVVTLSTTVTNAGNATADAFNVTFYEDYLYVIDQSRTVRVDRLDAGASKTLEVNMTLVGIGARAIHVVADSAYAIEESDELDNTLTAQLIVDNGAMPELRSFIIGDDTGYANDTHVHLALNVTYPCYVRLSNDDATWCKWLMSTEIAQWTLSRGDGDKCVYAELRSSAGVIRASAAVTLDTSEPTITITHPTSDADISASKIMLRGITEPNITVVVNGHVTTADANGEFAVELSLAEGSNLIVVVVTDNAGNTNTHTLSLKLVHSEGDNLLAEPFALTLGALVLLMLILAIMATLYVRNSPHRGRGARQEKAVVKSKSTVPSEMPPSDEIASAEPPHEPVAEMGASGHGDACIVCLGNLKDDMVPVKCLNCGALFHQSCAKRVVHCPECDETLAVSKHLGLL